MTNGSDRLDRIEHILEQMAKSHQQFEEQVAKSQREFEARQQYHDEAFERHDAEMKALREALVIDSENIRALARIAEHHNRRLEDLEGGEPN
jgi:uncharacterized membrane protein YccC